MIDFLFSEDISGYNVFKLAQWIKKCRTALKLNDRLLYQEDYRRYALDVYEFCEAWKAYAQEHKAVYNSAKYRDALLYIALSAPKFYLSPPDGQIDISTEITNFLCEDSLLCSVMQGVASKEEKRISDYKKRITKFLNNERSQLSHLINEIKEESVTYKVALLRSDNILYNGMPLEELLPLLNRRKLVQEERKHSQSADKTYSNYVREKLKEAQIGKNAYYSYIDDDDKTGCRKVFCTNLAFFLCLSVEDAQRLYMNDGYSIIGSKRGNDEILETCFRLGFPIEYADALLFKEGYPTLNIERNTAKI